MRIVDFRSDTVTLPTPEMLKGMVDAKVGDDVFSDDPSVNMLEEKAAKIMGKEAAVFVASGTMGNLVSVLAHCERGGEIILGDQSHIFRSEGGGASALGGISYNTVTNKEDGTLDPDDVRSAIRDYSTRLSRIHSARTSLVALENTHNSCGGSPLTASYTESIASIAHENGLPLHIDGARIFNAAVSLETPVDELVKSADSISFCLSKGLSCPVGSIVCGSHSFVERAREWRKMVGGGMRQAGFLAAAGIIALDSMVERLAEDHANAKRLAKGLSGISGISIDPDKVHTNLVFFDVDKTDNGAAANKLSDLGIKGGSTGGRWRFVTHYGITPDDIDYALESVDKVFSG